MSRPPHLSRDFQLPQPVRVRTTTGTRFGKLGEQLARLDELLVIQLGNLGVKFLISFDAKADTQGPLR